MLILCIIDIDGREVYSYKQERNGQFTKIHLSYPNPKTTIWEVDIIRI